MGATGQKSFKPQTVREILGYSDDSGSFRAEWGCGLLDLQVENVG